MAFTRDITVRVTFPEDWNPERAQATVQKIAQDAIDAIVGIKHEPDGHEVGRETPLEPPSPTLPDLTPVKGSEAATTAPSGERTADREEIPRKTRPEGAEPGSTADPQQIASDTEVPAGGYDPRRKDHGKAGAETQLGDTAGGTPSGI